MPGRRPLGVTGPNRTALRWCCDPDPACPCPPACLPLGPSLPQHLSPHPSSAFSRRGCGSSWPTSRTPAFSEEQLQPRLCVAASSPLPNRPFLGGAAPPGSEGPEALGLVGDPSASRASLAAPGQRYLVPNFTSASPPERNSQLVPGGMSQGHTAGGQSILQPSGQHGCCLYSAFQSDGKSKTWAAAGLSRGSKDPGCRVGAGSLPAMNPLRLHPELG